MGFFDSTAGRVAAGWSTGGLSEVYRAMRPGGGGAGYAALPFDNGAGNAVDNGRIAQEFQRVTGRAATKNELEQYAQYIKNGDMTYGDIGQVLQGLPEQDRARLDAYATQYGNALGANDQNFLGQAADIFSAKANSQFASLGRPNTSAMAAQVFGKGGQLAGQLAQQRQSAIAAFYGQGLQNNMGAYRDQGQNTLHRAYNLQDGRTAFNRGLLGYQTQRNDYNTDLSNQNAENKRRAYDQLGMGLVGAGVGGAFGGVGGARLGAGIGSSAGGLF